MKYEPWKKLNEHMLFTIICGKSHGTALLQRALLGNMETYDLKPYLYNCQINSEAKRESEKLFHSFIVSKHVCSLCTESQKYASLKVRKRKKETSNRKL